MINNQTRVKMKVSIKIWTLKFVFILLYHNCVFSQDYSKFKPIAVNGYYFRNIVPFSEPSQVGFGVVIPAYINNDSLLDFYSTKTKYPQNVNSGRLGNEVTTFEIFLNQGEFIFKKATKQYVKDSIFIIRDDGINVISDLNGDGVNDLVFTGEPFHHHPQSAYYDIGIRNKIDVDSSRYYARRANVLVSNNGMLIDSIGYLDSLLLKSYFGALVFDWNNDGKNDLVLSERGDGKTFQFWENKGNKMSLDYFIAERDTLQVVEGPFNLAAYDLNKDGFKDFVFSAGVERHISQNGNVYVCFNNNGKFNDSSVVNIISHRSISVEKNGLAATDIQINDLDNDGNPEIVALFSHGSGDHSVIDNNKIKSIIKVITYKEGRFLDVTKSFFTNQQNENLFYGNRLFKLIDLDNDGLVDLYPITGDNGCTSKLPQGCGYFGYQGIDSTVYFKNKNGSFELKTIGLFFSDTASQNVYHDFKSRKINIGGYNLALGNQIVPYFVKGIKKPVFVAGIQKQSVEMYEGVIYNDSLKDIRSRIIQNSFLNYNFRAGFVLVPCETQKPSFNTERHTFCNGDSLTLSITNANPSDSIKWYFGNKVDFTNTRSKRFGDTTTLYVIRKDSIGCTISSDIIKLTNHPRISNSFTVNNASQCLTGNNFAFTNTSTISSGTLTHIWSFGDGGSANTANTSRTYTAAGNYNVKLLTTSSFGCRDSVIRQVTVHPMPAKPTINWDGINLSAANTYASYQWLLNNSAVTGANAAEHKPVNPGSYRVRITNTPGCADTSDAFNLVVTAAGRVTQNQNKVAIYPNPATSSVFIDLGKSPSQPVSVQLLTIEGRPMTNWILQQQRQEFAIDHIQNGTYLIQIVEGKTKTIHKVVIQTP